MKDTHDSDCPELISRALFETNWNYTEGEGWWHPPIAGMYYTSQKAAEIAILNSILPD